MENLLEQSSLKNHLGLFSKDGDADIERTRDFLKISRAQLAQALGYSVEQIRPERMSDLAKQSMQDLAGTLEFVAEIFHGDVTKTLFWVKTPNAHFGGVSPKDMILRGRYKKVHSFVLAALGRAAQKTA